jgi:hypothetical protein
MARDQREEFIWTFFYLDLQNLSWENGVLLKNTFPSHVMPPTLIAHISVFPASKSKKNRRTVSGHALQYYVYAV